MKGNIDVTVTVTKDDANNTLKASVAYGDKTSFTNKLVTTSIPPTPPTVDKPELKLYNIQLHKANADGNALAGAVFGLFESRWYYSCSQSLWRRTSDSNF